MGILVPWNVMQPCNAWQGRDVVLLVKPSLANKFTVLVVDDDPGILETMGDILNEMNFTVTTASDGYQAIALVKSGSYDAILLDLRMPGIDGIETLKCIKETRPDAKVILVTAYASDERVLAARREGASTVLYKPIDLSKIEGLLRTRSVNIDPR